MQRRVAVACKTDPAAETHDVRENALVYRFICACHKRSFIDKDLRTRMYSLELGILTF
jgi:hypothetical protein